MSLQEAVPPRPPVTCTGVDGVPVFWVPTRGPLHAGLMFRAGMADETLATAGQTHLLEHLALHGLADAGLGTAATQGQVDQTVTTFQTSGEPEAVVGFLRHVCRALHAPPAARLEAEKGVLEAEEASRARGPASSLLAWRFGAQTYGLTGLAPYGVTSATTDDLAALASERFTRGNAALWLTGAPPAGLELPLPDGPRLAPPAVRPVLPPRAAWFHDDNGGIAAAGLLPRGTAAIVLGALAQQRLRSRLRGDLALSYAPGVQYERLADMAHLVFHADSAPGARADLAVAFADLVAELAEDTDADALERARESWLAEHRATRRHHGDDLATSDVTCRTHNLLHGHPDCSYEQLAREIATIGLEEVREAACRFRAQALYALPHAAPPRPVFGEEAPPSLSPPVQGRELRHVDARRVPNRLILAEDGVTLRQPGTELPITVRFDEVEVVLRFPDGGAMLVGRDASHLRVAPAEWRSRSLARDLDDALARRVDASLVLPRPAPDDEPAAREAAREDRLPAWRRVLRRG